MRNNRKHNQRSEKRVDGVIPPEELLTDVNAPPFTPSSAFRRRGSARSVAHLILVVTLLSISWVGLSHIGTTVSYFSDAEYSQGNVFESGLLDLTLENQNTSSAGLACGAAHTFSVRAEAESQSIDSQYRVYVEHTDGDACNAFMLTADRKGEQVFRGLPLDFSGVVTDEFGPWNFEFLLPQDATGLENGASCTVDVVFNAWRKDAHLFTDSGYTDTERVRLSVTKEGSSGLPARGAQAGTTTVVNKNTGVVVSTTTSSANTGDNTSNVAGNTASSSSLPARLRATRGQAASSSAQAGTIITGDATSTATTQNTVNVNTTTTNGSTTATTTQTRATSSERTRDTRRTDVRERMQNMRSRTPPTQDQTTTTPETTTATTTTQTSSTTSTTTPEE